MVFALYLVWALFALATSSESPPQKPIGHFDPKATVDQRTESLPAGWELHCKEHTITAHEMINGTVAFGFQQLKEHPSTGKMSGINSTAWEQWEFDSVSRDGSSGVFLSLARDASYAAFGQGNLHAEFYALLDDGTAIQELAFVDHSSVFDCDGYVVGQWTSKSHSFEFQIKSNTGQEEEDNNAVATFSVRMPKFRGDFEMHGTTAGHFPDGSQTITELGSTADKIAPGLHVHSTIPSSEVQGNMSFGSARNPGATVSYNGIGGHMHLWAIDNWFKIVWGFRIVRGTAGPYSFFYWEPISRLGDAEDSTSLRRESSYSGALFKDGKRLVATQTAKPEDKDKVDRLTNSISAADTDSDSVRVISKVRGPGARAGVASRSTGHLVEFWSGQEGSKHHKHWRFELEHQHVQVEMAFGGGNGIAVFTNRVFGGEVGGCQYLGGAFSEEAEFPEVLAQWKLWLVYGVGMASQLKAGVQDWLDVHLERFLGSQG